MTEGVQRILGPMNEQKPTNPDRLFKVFCLIGVVILASAIVWMNFRVEDLSKKVERNDQATTSDGKSTVSDQTNTGWNTTLKSGKQGFEMTVPDGWGPLMRDTTSDFFVMVGKAQPNVVKGNKVVVTDIQGYGTDSLSLFTVMLSDTEFAPPQGTSETFTIGKADEELVGKKYTYIYPKDDIIGIGHQRFQGDRDYEYVFPAKGKELHVYYNVYGSDPRNLSDTVDEIVRTIRLQQN